MYKMILALIPAVLAASIGAASAQSPSAQGFFSNGPKFAPYFSPNGVFGGGPEYGYGYAYRMAAFTVTPIRLVSTITPRVLIFTYIHRVRSEYDGLLTEADGSARCWCPQNGEHQAVNIGNCIAREARRSCSYLSPAR
jgi:hypothetical protein